MRERALERGLLIHLRDLLLELGRGFAFLGSQVPLSVGDQIVLSGSALLSRSAPLLLRHRTQDGEFKPEYAGKLNFYLSAVDGIMRTERDDPTIGLLLCETKNEAIVELSFKNVQKPIGISTYTVTRELPKALDRKSRRLKT